MNNCPECRTGKMTVTFFACVQHVQAFYMYNIISDTLWQWWAFTQSTPFKWWAQLTCGWSHDIRTVCTCTYTHVYTCTLHPSTLYTPSLCRGPTTHVRDIHVHTCHVTLDWYENSVHVHVLYNRRKTWKCLTFYCTCTCTCMFTTLILVHSGTARVTVHCMYMSLYVYM